MTITFGAAVLTVAAVPNAPAVTAAVPNAPAV